MNQMQQMMKQVKKMQEQMMKAQEELGDKTVEGTAGGGVVSITMNGHRKVTALTIKEEAVDSDDIEMLQDLVLTAINDALTKVEKLIEQDMGRYTSGMKVPGLF